MTPLGMRRKLSGDLGCRSRRVPHPVCAANDTMREYLALESTASNARAAQDTINEGEGDQRAVQERTG